jgi:hypothetical protein
MIHGDQDMNNPIAASQKMAEEAKAAGVETVFAVAWRDSPGSVSDVRERVLRFPRQT